MALNICSMTKTLIQILGFVLVGNEPIARNWPKLEIKKNATQPGCKLIYFQLLMTKGWINEGDMGLKFYLNKQ